MWVLYLILGVVSGIFGGFFGIGGGTILIPALIYIFGLTQHQAQGTSLAIMIPPIGLLAAMKYYMEGNVKINMALFICAGFFVGGFLGAYFAQKIPDNLLKKIFGLFLFFISLKMIFK